MKRLLLLALALVFAQVSRAQERSTVDVNETLFRDRNGNGVSEIAAFGDSITRGVGDFLDPGSEGVELTHPNVQAGYALRIERLLGLPVVNHGEPGEELTGGGVVRFAATIPGTRPDVVIISEGANDAGSFVGQGRYWRSLQMMINMAVASGVSPVLATIVPSSDDHRFERPGIELFNGEIRRLSVINSLPLVEFDRAFRNTCDIDRCSLMNRPDGLHPNSAGYDVMGETVVAAAVGIDLFALDGPQLLEQALQLPAGSVRTRPDPIPPPQ